MEKSKELLDKANIIPPLRLGNKIEGGGVKSTGPHRVKLVSDKLVMGLDPMTGQERQEVKYLVEENGQQKTYNVPIKDKKGELHYLIQRLAEFNEGDEIILEMKKKGVKNFIEVTAIGEKNNEPEEALEEEIDFEDFGGPEL